MKNKHWSRVEYLHETVKNQNIIIKGQHSYYSDCWDDGFETSVVRYLYGDEVSLQWEPLWEIDKLYVGDYVCIGAQAVILMGGNHTHRMDWFSLYPFMDKLEEAYIGKGDTHIHDGVWIGMRAMIMPGVTIGEGAIVAANSVVSKNVEPYSIVGGIPARHLKYRFEPKVIEQLLSLKIYQWSEKKFETLRPLLCQSSIDKLLIAEAQFIE
ncbi:MULTISPECIES: CatB-related O-acetyltransferase [Proteus]|uniref:Chloramphenicol acetyltransferase n=1 Tax=Proteus penneri TaxID=102862 RepID=A0ABS0W0U4_9GAMM|nr:MULTISPECIES: CatB-related O-acetyltransferase [Proteus]EEG85876.1 bacterial transferase hexapeptide repeat protein [Proteus penneri ATCC 35198]MBJ2116921.1 CatB-related O-acetyltransferase [Proteus penneri]MCO8049221.1 CatB-related O-acetyltransferase [Proteus penneri]MCX2587263.1 CatB-related O-acetyltransferase [Proteus penneri]NBL78806.1 antibiotic acetyltransferase [Proteus sp. G2672]